MKPGNPPAFSGKGANSGGLCSQDEGNRIDVAIPDDSGIFSLFLPSFLLQQAGTCCVCHLFVKGVIQQK